MIPRRCISVWVRPALSALRAGRTQTEMHRRGITFQTDAYIVDEHLIWGATARILDHLLERLSADGSGLALAQDPGQP